MLKTEVARGPGGRVLLLDSITKIGAEDAGTIVVTGSHGGASAGEFSLAVPLRLVVFNDAGVGKDRAGIVALEMLQQKGVAAAAASHDSARIGDAADMWANGVVSHINALAAALGLKRGDPVRACLGRLIDA
jgi:hypothetical protein